MLILQGSGAAQSGARPARHLGAAPIFSLYFLALCVLGFLSGYVTPGLGWTATAAQVGQVGFSDPVSFITAALDIARNEWVSPANYWLIHLWPPGFMVIEAAILRVFGEDAPLLLVLLVLAALCCAGWMVLLRQLLLPATSRLTAALAPALPFVFPLTPFFLLSPLGLVFGETFAISAFIASFLLVLLACRDRSWPRAILAGVVLAMSAYLRSQFELFVVFLSLAAGVMALVAITTRLWRGPAWPRGWDVAMVLVTVIVAQLAMAPWRYFNYLDSGEPVWVHTSKLVARNSMATEQELRAGGGGFVIEGAGHLACKLEPSSCGKSDPALFYGAFFHHPAAWLLEKARVLPTYWFAPPIPASLSAVSVPPTLPQAIANLLLLACIGAGAWRLWSIRREPEFGVQAWFQLSLYGALAAVYTMAHLEARYFYLPKIFAVVALLTLLVPGRARRTLDEVNP